MSSHAMVPGPTSSCPPTSAKAGQPGLWWGWSHGPSSHPRWRVKGERWNDSKYQGCCGGLGPGVGHHFYPGLVSQFVCHLSEQLGFCSGGTALRFSLQTLLPTAKLPLLAMKPNLEAYEPCYLLC